ncbi:MAG: hypothetical protein LBJ89_02855 [Holosporales bacterium]|nr:hypothetical protein [Holosporales bacterium]
MKRFLVWGTSIFLIAGSHINASNAADRIRLVDTPSYPNNPDLKPNATRTANVLRLLKYPATGNVSTVAFDSSSVSPSLCTFTLIGVALHSIESLTDQSSQSQDRLTSDCQRNARVFDGLVGTFKYASELAAGLAVAFPKHVPAEFTRICMQVRQAEDEYSSLLKSGAPAQRLAEMSKLIEQKKIELSDGMWETMDEETASMMTTANGRDMMTESSLHTTLTTTQRQLSTQAGQQTSQQSPTSGTSRSLDKVHFLQKWLFDTDNEIRYCGTQNVWGIPNRVAS